MEVLLARNMGFCYGVRRAVDMAFASENLATFGPLIHNPQMIDKLAARGVAVIDSLSQATGRTVLVRSHGVGPEVYDEAARCAIALQGQPGVWGLAADTDGRMRLAPM